jgi:hypothetical protein
MALRIGLMSLCDHIHFGTSVVAGFSSGGYFISTDKVMMSVWGGKHAVSHHYTLYLFPHFYVSPHYLLLGLTLDTLKIQTATHDCLTGLLHAVLILQ